MATPTSSYRLSDRTLDQLRELTELLRSYDPIRPVSRAGALAYAVDLAVAVARQELQPDDGAVMLRPIALRGSIGARGATESAAA